MMGWHHQLNGHEFEKPQGGSEGQKSLAHYGPWGCKGSDMTEQLSMRSQLLFHIDVPSHYTNARKRFVNEETKLSI